MANNNAQIIDSIKASVKLKSTGIPFLLMPVRIETRFMERTFSVASINPTAVQDALLSLVALDNELYTNNNAFVPDRVHPIKKMTESCDSILQKIDMITPQEKSQLLEIQQLVADNISRWQEQVKDKHPEGAKAFLTPVNGIAHTINKIKIDVRKKTTDDNPLLTDQEKVLAVLENFTKGPRHIPYFNFKNKKALYGYVRKLMDDTGKYFDDAPGKVRKMKRIDKNHVRQMKDQHGRMNAAISKLTRAIGDIHKDKNWQHFSSNFATNSISVLQEKSRKFEKEAMRDIEQLPTEVGMKAHEVFFHGIKILMKVNKFNAERDTGYDTVKKFKKYVGPLFQTLSKSTAADIEETRPGHREKLQTLFAAIDNAFAKSREKVASFNAHNKAQAFGIQATLNFHDSIRKEIIEPLSKTADNPGLSAAAAATTAVKKQLCVRIYPDDIFLHTHEPMLTQTEVDNGKSFWREFYRAMDDERSEKAAWKTLCTTAGANRASWIAQQMDPRDMPANNISSNAVNSRLQQAIDLLQACAISLNGYDVYYPDLLVMLTNMETDGRLDYYITNFQQAEQLLQNSYNRLDSYNQNILVQNLKGLGAGTASLLTRINALSPAQKNQYAVHISKVQNMRVKWELVNNRWNIVATRDDLTYYRDIVPDVITFPSLPTKSQDWSQPPTSKVLPERFVAITLSNGQITHTVAGNTVTPNIQLGLDPTKFGNEELFKLDEQKNLVVDPGIKWMTDYETAEAAGMAISIDLTDTEWNAGIEKVVVIGVRDADAANSKLLLEELLTNHTYSHDGMAFLKPGTPTNNTAKRKSGFAPAEQEEQRFTADIRMEGYYPGEQDTSNRADGSYFGNLLGVDYKVVRRISNSTQLVTGTAFTMNRALWHATLGHYMEEMMDGVFTYDNIRRTEEFFTKHVTARGTIPSVRIGSQPYGIITTTAFSKWNSTEQLPPLAISELKDKVSPWGVRDAALNDKMQARFEYRLMEFLKMLNNTFSTIRNNYVVHSGNLQTGDPQQRFINMLGLHANSLEYFYRYNINIAKGPASGNHNFELNFNPKAAYGPVQMYGQFKEHMKNGIYSPSFFFEDENPKPGIDPYKLADIRYARIKQQLEESRLFLTRQVSSSFNTKGLLVADVTEDTDDNLRGLPGIGSTYIGWLLSQKPSELFGGNDLQNKQRFPDQSLLFILLRQSLLQATQMTALNMLQDSNLITEDFRKKVGSSKVYYNSFSTNKILTKWNYLFDAIDILGNNGALSGRYWEYSFYNDLKQRQMPLADYIHNNLQTHTGFWNTYHQRYVDKLNEVRRAFIGLDWISVRNLEQLMAEHLDLCTYRIDAWMLGLVKKKMEERRVNNPTGIYLGAFGYVEGLKREKKTLFTDNTRLSPFQLQSGKPVYQDLLNQGAIHAPSINHAIAAAVLRNAYKSNDAAPEAKNRLAVNLSSARVRMAMQLAEGIRNGQALGALLGFRLERGLHEAYQTVELDRFIQPLRKAYPLMQQVQVIAGDNGPSYASQVINGDELLKDVYAAVQWQSVAMNTANSKTLGELLKTPGNALPEKIRKAVGNQPVAVYNAIIDEIDKIADAFDALGDLAISESVYQMVQGNHVRAAAVMDALAAGKSIPDPQVIEFPRTGNIVTQRIVLNLEPIAKGTRAQAWTGSDTVKSLAEPSLNYWMGKITGPASNYKYIIQTIHPDNSITQTDFSLDMLGWQPIDIFTLQGDEHELSNILLTYYRLANPTQTGNVTIDIVSRSEDWGETTSTLTDLLLTVSHVRKLLANAKMLGANDLQPSGVILSDTNPGAIRDAELQSRMESAFAALKLFNQQVAAIPAVNAVLSGNKSAEEIILTEEVYLQLISFMKMALALGIPQAMAWKYDPSEAPIMRYRSALQYVLNLYNQTKERELNGTTLLGSINVGMAPKDKTEKLLELAKTILGNNFMIVPTFDFNDPGIGVQVNLPANKKITRNGDSMVMESWMQQLSKVRSKVRELSRYMQHADLFDSPAISVYPVQLPYSDQDYWLGVEYPSSYEPGGDKLSLILLQEQLLKTTGPKAGLLLDEWIEIIPGKEETTGVSFHYNQPNATAPQSVLLVNSPQTGNSWVWDDLINAVIDTVELAKNRAVEPDHLENSMLSHVLPAIISEVVPPREKAQNKAYGSIPTMDFSENQPIKK